MPHVLLVTETSDLAADLLVIGARRRDISLLRFNQDEFPWRARVAWQNQGETRFWCEGVGFAADEVSGAWFRRPPRLPVAAEPAAAFACRESQGFLAGVWDTAHWFWMNAPWAAARAEHKLFQLRQAETLGLTVPATLATNCPASARSFVGARAAVAKTLVGGRVAVGAVEHAAFTTAISLPDIADDEAVQASPVIFQSRIDTFVDLRVTVVCDRVFAAAIALLDRTPADVDWRSADPARVRYRQYDLPAQLQARCVELVAAMRLSYGALDFVVTPDGEHVFLELNPAGQWGWIERALGLPITDTILTVLVGHDR